MSTPVTSPGATGDLSTTWDDRLDSDATNREAYYDTVPLPAIDAFDLNEYSSLADIGGRIAVKDRLRSPLAKRRDGVPVTHDDRVHHATSGSSCNIWTRTLRTMSCAHSVVPRIEPPKSDSLSLRPTRSSGGSRRRGGVYCVLGLNEPRTRFCFVVDVPDPRREESAPRSTLHLSFPSDVRGQHVFFDFR